MLAPIGPVHERFAPAEARPLVDPDRPPVEGGHDQPVPGRRVPSARELQTRQQEGEPEPATGEVGSQSQPDLDRVPLAPERKEPEEVALVV